MFRMVTKLKFEKLQTNTADTCFAIAKDLSARFGLTRFMVQRLSALGLSLKRLADPALLADPKILRTVGGSDYMMVGEGASAKSRL